MENLCRRSSRSRFASRVQDVLALEDDLARRSARSAGSGSAPAWTCPEPDRPMTTNTSPGGHVEAHVADGGDAAGLLHQLPAGQRDQLRSTPARSSAFGPNTFHRSPDRDDRLDRGAGLEAGRSLPGPWCRRASAALLRSPVRPRGAQPRNQSLRLRADVLPDVLGLAVLRQPGRSELAPDAGLLEAAPLGLRHVGVVVVDPHRAVPQPPRHPLRACRRPASRPPRPGRTSCRWRCGRRRPRR